MLLILILGISVEGNPDCISNRPTATNFQSGVCCYPSWKVRDYSHGPENLDILISKLPTLRSTANWFVHVTNFRHVQLYNSLHPILLQWPVPVIEKW